MSRRIKFRAWEKEKNRMLDWDKYADFIIDAIPVGAGDEYTEQFELMQFVGITDKNGVEIYEGDIVNFENSGLVQNIGEVIWNSDQSMGGLEWGLWTNDGYLKTDFLGCLEVIGSRFTIPKKETNYETNK